MRRIGLTGLAVIEFPTRTVALCDGGFVTWGETVFRSADAVFGTIGAIDALGEGVGDEVPALNLTLLPPGESQPAEVVQPGFQTARARFWIAEYDVESETHAVVGDPNPPLFDGQVDQCVLRLGASRQIDMTVVSLAERLFEGNIGNALTAMWHKSVWPGETGHDNATGLTMQVAWGAEKPPSSGQAYTPTPYGTPRRVHVRSAMR